MANLLTKVTIGGTTVKDDSGSDPKLIISWEFEEVIERGIAEIELVALQSIEDTETLTIGKEIKVFEGFTTSTDLKRFTGDISNIKREGGLIIITAKDPTWDLVKKIVNNTYLDTGAQAGEVSAIAQDLIETFGGLTASVQATGTAIGEVISEFRCRQTDIYERLMVLSKAVQYQLYFDFVNDKVNFEPRGFIDNGVNLTVGTEIIGVPKWDEDTDSLVNDLRVDGATIETNLRFPISGTGQIETTANFENEGITLPFTPESAKLTIDAVDPPTTIREGGGVDSSSTGFFFIDKENKRITPASGTTFDTDDFAFVDYTWLAPAPIHMFDQNSIDTYTLFQKQIELADVVSISDAEARARQILERFSTPFLSSELLVKRISTLNLKVGETVTIIDSINKPNINKKFIITKLLSKYPGSFQEVTVGDEALRMKDWHFNVEERIKRLEERFLENQDLILELFNFNLSKIIQPRYRKIFTETVGGTNLFILGHSSFGLLGTGQLGDTDMGAETDHFIQQFDNSYIENFIDDDFEGAGNASWSTTGSVTFTAGQIALSSSIDFNNGTITIATLNSTEVSGSFDYEMTADGSNWESVTPGTTHTFSNTGTDLRFRITENSASTGEISQVTISSYH